MIRPGPFVLPLILLAGVVALVLSLRAYALHHYELGHAAGHAERSSEADAALAEAQAKIDQLAELARDRARDLEEAEVLTQSLFEELADEADRDPAGIVLSADSVRRLNAVAGHAADPAAP